MPITPFAKQPESIRPALKVARDTDSGGAAAIAAQPSPIDVASVHPRITRCAVARVLRRLAAQEGRYIESDFLAGGLSH